jgi:hypothetical protein
MLNGRVRTAPTWRGSDLRQEKSHEPPTIRWSSSGRSLTARTSRNSPLPYHPGIRAGRGASVADSRFGTRRVATRQALRHFDAGPHLETAQSRRPQTTAASARVGSARGAPDRSLKAGTLEGC